MEDRQPSLRVERADTLVVEALRPGTEAGGTAATEGELGVMRNPKITTDRTVDTSSLDSIVGDVIGPDMDDEQKALALYRFFRQTVYHYGWPYMCAEREENWQDPAKVINVHGYSLCGSQARVFGRILSRVFGDGNVRLIGFTEAERGAWQLDRSPGAFRDSVMLRGSGRIPRMGHTSLEVRYGGRWRLIDPHVGFYAYRRDGGGIASAEDCIADPSLVIRPTRRVRGLMPCGDLSRVFHASRFVNWGNLTRDAAPDDHVMDITLRRGDTYTRYWDRRGPFAWFSQMDRRWEPEYLALGPRHLCEGDSCWRHYGNGDLIYRPRLRDGSYRDGVTVEAGVAPSSPSGLAPARAGAMARVVFATRIPYMAVASQLSVDFTRQTGSDQVRIWVRPEGGAWRLVWREPRCGRLRRRLDLSPWANGRYTYDIRFDLLGARRADHAALHGFTLETAFLLNYLALPRLVPGRNRVRVSVADPRVLRDQKLEVSYAWSEEDGGHDDRRLITSSPHDYTITLGPVAAKPPENPKYMRFLRLAVR